MCEVNRLGCDVCGYCFFYVNRYEHKIFMKNRSSITTTKQSSVEKGVFHIRRSFAIFETLCPAIFGYDFFSKSEFRVMKRHRSFKKCFDVH